MTPQMREYIGKACKPSQRCGQSAVSKMDIAPTREILLTAASYLASHAPIYIRSEKHASTDWHDTTENLRCKL